MQLQVELFLPTPLCYNVEDTEEILHTNEQFIHDLPSNPNCIETDFFVCESKLVETHFWSDLTTL